MNFYLFWFDPDFYRYGYGTILTGIQEIFCRRSLISATEIITGTWRGGVLFSPESLLQCLNAKCGCLLGHAVIGKMRRRWQQVGIEMQQDSWENLATCALCFRTGCNSNLQESSCEVTKMTSTSIGLCQIFLLTAVSLLQTTGNGRKQHNGKCENAQQREAVPQKNSMVVAKWMKMSRERGEDSTLWLLSAEGRWPTSWFQSHPAHNGGHFCANNVDVSLLMLEWLLFACLSLVYTQLGFNYHQNREGMQLSSWAETLERVF